MDDAGIASLVLAPLNGERTEDQLVTEEFNSEEMPTRAASHSLRSPAIRMLVSAEILLLGFVVAAALTRSWSELVIPALLAVAAPLPAVLETGFRAWFPAWMHGFYLGFLLAGPFAGGRLGFYHVWNPWDNVVHAFSGFLVGFAVIFAFGVIGRRHLLVFPPFLLTAGILTTGGFAAAAWEIAEYTSDHLLGSHAQEAGLEGTMTDIICGVAGSTMVAIMMSIHHRGHRLALVDSLLRNRFAPVAPGMQDSLPPAEPPPVTDTDEE